jgi:hypothetical protein
MIQDAIAPQRPLSFPIYKLVFLIPGGLKRRMIQDAILFQRIERNTFAATGGLL